MGMSDDLHKRLLQLFPNHIIYTPKMYKNPTVAVKLTSEAQKSGMQKKQFAEVSGFVWKEIEAEMDYSGRIIIDGADAVSVANQIYDSQAFLGNAILTEEQRNALTCYAKAVFKKHFVEGNSLTITEKKILILETIYVLQERDAQNEEDGMLYTKMWLYIFKHFCGRILDDGSKEYQNYYRFFRNALETVMRTTNHLLVPSKKCGVGYQRYYDTLLIHALEPSDAVNRFFSILFNFYVSALDCQYISGDPVFKLLVKAIKAKWNRDSEALMEDSLYKVKAGSAAASASFKILMELYPAYSSEFCEEIIRKMDVVASREGVEELLDTRHFRIDLLVYRWFQQQSKVQRNKIQNIRKDHINDQVAIRKDDIKASYKLMDGIACIVLPKIRFEEDVCQQIDNGYGPCVSVFLDERKIFTERLKIFGDQFYTSKLYYFMLEQAKGETLHYSVKITIGEDGLIVYDSGKTLYRECLILSRNLGYEIRNIQKTAHGLAYLYVPQKANVEFWDDSDNIYEESCSFAQQFALDLNDLHCLTVNGADLYTDETAKGRLQIKLYPEKISAVSMVFQEMSYAVRRKVEDVHIKLPDAEKPERYQISLDGKAIPLAVFLRSKEALLAAINREGPHTVEVLDLIAQKKVCSYFCFTIPGFTYELDAPIYFDEQKCITLQTQDASHGQRKFMVSSQPGCDEILIRQFSDDSDLRVSLPVVHASIIQNGKSENIFIKENKDIWKGDFQSDTFMSVDCPRGWAARVFLGNDELVCSKIQHLYEIGNFIQGNKVTDSQRDLIMRLEESDGANVLLYNIMTMHFKPYFLTLPVVYDEPTLNWQVEGNFVGDKSQEFRVLLYDVEEEPYQYTVLRKDETMESNLRLSDGVYSIAIKAIRNNLFSKRADEEIYKGQLIVGNPDEFMYRHAALYLKSALCWNIYSNNYETVNLRPYITRIAKLEFMDRSRPPYEATICPHYRGTLQFYDTRKEMWRCFCDDFSQEEYEKINPVEVWLINDHTLAMYTEGTDPVMINSKRGSIQNKNERTLNRAEKSALQLPDNFQYEMERSK